MTWQDLEIPRASGLPEDRTVLFPWTVDLYHSLIEQGFLPEGEPYELLDGQLVRKDRSATGEDPMTIGHRHAWVMGELGELNAKLRRLGCHIRLQLPLLLPPFDEPEPDAAIVRGSNSSYRERHPGCDDVLCVIEVAESSLARDRSQKLRIYAAAGIPRYLIINLAQRVIEVYTNPLPANGGTARYGRMETLQPGARVELPGAKGKKLLVPVRKLLP